MRERRLRIEPKGWKLPLIISPSLPVSPFSLTLHSSSSVSASNKDEFRKPQWFEEAETDDELFDDDRKFAFQVFTSPLEMQRHFERQLQRLLESLNDTDGKLRCPILNQDFTKWDFLVFPEGFERDLKEDFLKPGFESKILKQFEQQKDMSLDTDLDGE